MTLFMIQGWISLWKIILKIVDVVNVVMMGGITMVDLLLSQFPVITLNSGVRICNFSSFHSYWLRTDEHDEIGNTLPACTKEVADNHKLVTEEVLTPRWSKFKVEQTTGADKPFFEMYELDRHDPDWLDVELSLSIDLYTMQDLHVLAKMEDLDIILVPYPIQSILNERWRIDTKSYVIWCKSRTCRKIDPRDISQGVYSNKFCV